MPSLSSETSKLTVPVRPAMSNGCLGYIDWVMTPWLSLMTSYMRPLHTFTVAGGSTVGLPQPVIVAGLKLLAMLGGFMSPWRDTPQSVGSRSPERVAGLPFGASKVSQNAMVAGASALLRRQLPCGNVL